MSKVEKEAGRKRRNRNIQTALLTTAVVGGIVLLGGVPPPNYLLQLFGRKNKARAKYQVKAVIARLAKRGEITFVHEGGYTLARITQVGKNRLALEEPRLLLRAQSRKRWDKRWRVIIFDIPERRRAMRDRLRATMHRAGLYRLQDSVWLYPYDCEDFIALIKANLKLGNAVLYMVVEQIENDAKLREHFHII